MGLARRSSPPSPSPKLRRTKTRRSRRGALSILFPRTLQMMSSLPRRSGVASACTAIPTATSTGTSNPDWSSGEAIGRRRRSAPSVSPPSSLDAATSGVSFPRTFRIAWGTRCHFRSGIIPSVPTSTGSTSCLVDSSSTPTTPSLLMARPFSSDALSVLVTTHCVSYHCYYLKISSYAC